MVSRILDCIASSPHFKHNPASGRVLKKLGMRHEGCQREHLRKWNQFVDSELYGLLRREWQASVIVHA
jgi:RimJ/RimL family protein N-acetyltransferase